MDPVVVAILILLAVGLLVAVVTVSSAERIGFVTAIKRLFMGPLGPK